MHCSRITLLFSVINDLNNRGGHSTSLIALLLRDDAIGRKNLADTRR